MTCHLVILATSHIVLCGAQFGWNPKDFSGGGGQRIIGHFQQGGLEIADNVD